jgi:hypothetical protein
MWHCYAQLNVFDVLLDPLLTLLMSWAGDGGIAFSGQVHCMHAVQTIVMVPSTTVEVEGYKHLI